MPPGWTEWRGMENVALLRLHRSSSPTAWAGTSRTPTAARRATTRPTCCARRRRASSPSRSQAGEPFFLYLAFKAPHLPQIPAPRHDGLFQGIPPWRPPSYNEADVSDKPQWVQDLALQNSAQLDQIRIDQLEMLQAVDEAIGGNPAFGIVGIMEHLRNLGVADNTIVVFFADNGWYWGEHRLRAKNNPYEEAIRSPMFVRYPKLAPLKRDGGPLRAQHRPGAYLRRAGGRRRADRARRREPVRVLDGTAPTWRTDFLAESLAGQPPVGARARGAVEVHRAAGRSRATRRRSSRPSCTT